MGRESSENNSARSRAQKVEDKRRRAADSRTSGGPPSSQLLELPLSDEPPPSKLRIGSRMSPTLTISAIFHFSLSRGLCEESQLSTQARRYGQIATSSQRNDDMLPNCDNTVMQWHPVNGTDPGHSPGLHRAFSAVRNKNPLNTTPARRGANITPVPFVANLPTLRAESRTALPSPGDTPNLCGIVNTVFDTVNHLGRMWRSATLRMHPRSACRRQRRAGITRHQAGEAGCSSIACRTIASVA